MQAMFEQKVLKMCGDLGGAYVGTEATVSSDEQSKGTQILSQKHKELVAKGNLRVQVANNVGTIGVVIVLLRSLGCTAHAFSYGLFSGRACKSLTFSWIRTMPGLLRLQPPVTYGATLTTLTNYLSLCLSSRSDCCCQLEAYECVVI